MTRTSSIAVVAALACLAAPAARAEGVAFRFTKAVYTDEKEAKLRAPEGVGCSEDTRVVVADTGNGRLVVYRLVAGVVSSGMEVKLPEIKYPTHVVLDAKGNTWVLDRKARRIARLGPKYTFAGWVEAKGTPGFAPLSFVLGPTGSIVAIDAIGPAVVELDPDGNALRRIALPKGQFADLWVDAQGKIFVLDSVAAQIWAAAKGETEFKAFTRSLKDTMNFPAQLVSNGRGRLFVVDQAGMGIVVLGVDGTYQGRQLAMGRAQGLLYYPAQMCVTANGWAVVADRGNNRVQVFSTLE